MNRRSWPALAIVALVLSGCAQNRPLTVRPAIATPGTPAALVPTAQSLSYQPRAANTNRDSSKYPGAAIDPSQCQLPF